MRQMKTSIAPLFLMMCVIFVMSCATKEKNFPGGKVTLRSVYKTLDEDEFKAMIKEKGFFDRRYNPGWSFPNQFKLVVEKEDTIIVDHTTGLVWHQSGSTQPLPYLEVKEWLTQLNQKGYGGYNNWRLPTLEEAASLLEATATKYRYIDPLFSPEQYAICTGDIYNENRFWGMSFQYGRSFRVGAMDPQYARPVTAYKSK